MIDYIAGYLMLFVALIYLIIGACLLVFDGKLGLCVAYIAYAIANVGLYIETIK